METVNESESPPEPPAPEPPRPRLTRATDDKVVSGLSAGLGRYFGIDPVVFRIAFVVMALAGGSGVLLYLVGWLLIPDDLGRTPGLKPGHERHQQLLAAVVGGLGLLLLLDELGPHKGGGAPVGLMLIGLGAFVLWSRRQGPQVPGGPTASPPPPASRPTTDPLPMAAPAEPPPRSALVPVTLSLLAILAGGLALLDTWGALSVSVVTGLALALLLTGGALIVGAWRGRARWLIPLGLFLGLALIGASWIDVPLRGGFGDPVYRPTTRAEVTSPYRLAAGQLTLDLRDLDLSGSTVTIVSSIGAGEILVIVPHGPTVVVDAELGVGEMDILGRHGEGTGFDRRVVDEGAEGSGRLVLRIEAGVGHVEVRRAST